MLFNDVVERRLGMCATGVRDCICSPTQYVTHQTTWPMPLLSASLPRLVFVTVVPVYPISGYGYSFFAVWGGGIVKWSKVAPLIESSPSLDYNIGWVVAINVSAYTTRQVGLVLGCSPLLNNWYSFVMQYA